MTLAKKPLVVSPQCILNKRPQHWCFLAEFKKFLRTPILKIICEQLPLKIT